MRTTIYIIIILLFSNTIQAQNYIQKSPKKAGIYSAIIPGVGQVYTKKYWTIPIIYTGLITSAYYIKENHNLYSLYKKTYLDREKGQNNDSFTDIYNNNELVNLTEQHKRNRDISVLLFSLTYILNIIDASVHAHLFNYDVNENISLNIIPTYRSENHIEGVTLSIKL